jgi:hypothetical protein
MQVYVSNFQRALAKGIELRLVEFGPGDWGAYGTEKTTGLNSFGTSLMARGTLEALQKEFPFARTALDRQS